MSDLLDRRRVELEAQLETLPAELEHWQALTAAGQPYEKHHSQMTALALQMQALNDRVAAAWNHAGDFTAIQKAQINCAAVHAVWNFFREKLVLRADPRLGDHLRAADAYVWACYEPVLADRRARHPGQPFREPPLVTFDTEQSPWALSRHSTYTPDGDPAGATRSTLFAQTLAAMPIALVGIPWTSTGRLPHLVTLAHECGHVVESDFGLAADVEEGLATATAASTLCDGWSHHWRKEVFADLFACYVAGPAFAWALTDIIPDSPETVRTKKRPTDAAVWGKYPPPTLRMLMNVRALRHFGHADAATAIWTYWKADYGVHAMVAYEQDVDLVVPAFYEAAGLPAALDYRTLAADTKRAHKSAVDLDLDLELEVHYDPRALVDLACALDRGGHAGAAAVWARLQRHIVSSRPPGQLAGDAGPAAAGQAWLRTDEIGDLLFSAAGVDADD